MRNWLDIVDVLFRYMGMLDKKGPQKWVFQEIRDVANIQYRRDMRHARRGGVCVKRCCGRGGGLRTDICCFIIFTIALDIACGVWSVRCLRTAALE